MRRFMVIWGYIVGKIGVRCTNCSRLNDEGFCFKTKISPPDQFKQRTCGFWKQKYSWIKRTTPGTDESVRLKSDDD